MVRQIKYAIMFAFAIVILMVTASEGLYTATAVFFPAAILYAFLYKYIERWEYRELLKQYAVMIENIYERSHFPGDSEVRRRAQLHRELLKESGNPEKITVHELYYQDGENCNETWEDFLQRCEAFRLEDRRKHHKKLSQESREWYIDNALNQN